MGTVADLIPGDVVRGIGGISATFIAATDHPIYAGLKLVLWRMSDGDGSHDALRPDQYVGEVEPADANGRVQALRTALQGARRSKSLSAQITRALGTDDWLILHDGHHLITADELDAKA